MTVTVVWVLRVIAAVCFGLAAIGWEPPRVGLIPAGLCLWVVSDIPGVG